MAVDEQSHAHTHIHTRSRMPMKKRLMFVNSFFGWWQKHSVTFNDALLYSARKHSLHVSFDWATDLSRRSGKKEALIKNSKGKKIHLYFSLYKWYMSVSSYFLSELFCVCEEIVVMFLSSVRSFINYVISGLGALRLHISPPLKSSTWPPVILVCP